ncbi:MAG: 16S rRNA (cytosine(1402)-N(4))-methyltransferase RsmH [Clostridiales bacterium]|nr:16S rRNA (cytosine(1402)-N(4))-methyltransferase RsmH [Clostridiales bacterium]
MEFSHVPVLYREVAAYMAVRPDGIYADGTLGGGGHAEATVRALGKDGVFIGIDRDTDALAAARQRLEALGDEAPCRKIFVHDNYANIKTILRDLGIGQIDGALLDLGVSSFQLDNPDRGFSYMQDAPLDMRMDQQARFSAYDVINEYTEADLAEIIRKYGEERYARRIAANVVRARQEAPITRSGQLVDIIRASIPAKTRREGPHPAKRTFQAIRIEVNDELGLLERAAEDFLDVLKPDGRLLVITFHSLEDRIIKNVFQRRADPCTCPPGLPCVCGKKADIRKITRKPIEADGEEREANPRARSAKLRVAEKIATGD